MPDENANPEAGSENQSPINIEAAFDSYLERQANPAGDEGVDTQPAAGAENNGQPAIEAKPIDPAAAEAEEQRFTVKINGEDKDIPLSELLKGYSLESDYRVKTSQVAEQARAAQAQQQQAQAERQQYQSALQTYQQRLASVQPQAPDPAMIETDPVGYLRQQQAVNAWQGQMQQAQWESQQLAQRTQQEQEQAANAHVAQERKALLEALPEWKDEAKATAGKAALSSYVVRMGYAPGEIAQAVDHRAIVMANKAMLYDQMVAKQAAVTNKVANLPPKSPLRPGSGDISPTDGRTRAMQSLKKSGSIDDAANAFAAILGAR